MARSSFTLTAEIPQLALKCIVAKLRPDAIYGGDLRAMLTEVAQEGEVRAFGRAPVGDTFALAQSITHTVDQRPIPTFAKITASAERSGFRYGWALQGAQKGTFRYRSTSRTGRPTYRWFTGIKPFLAKRLAVHLERLAKRAEARWRR